MTNGAPSFAEVLAKPSILGFGVEARDWVRLEKLMHVKVDERIGVLEH